MLANKDASIDGRRCRERTSLLLAYFKTNDREKLYRSGIDEEEQKEQLLQEVFDLSVEYEKKYPQKVKRKMKKALEIRIKALESLKSASTAESTSDLGDEHTQPKRRRSTTSLIQYLTDKNTMAQDIEKERLNLEKDKLQMEKRKQDMETERFRLEKEGRVMMIKLLTNLVQK